MQRILHIVTVYAIHQINAKVPQRPENADSLIKHGVISKIDTQECKEHSTAIVKVMQGLPLVKDGTLF
jgi:hypothetical protein